MKKINFEELMASVSEQFVEEAASFSPIKAFNTRFVALVACIAIIVTAIPAVVILNREKDVDAPKVTTPVEDIVVTPGGEETDKKNTNVIYCDTNLSKDKELIKTLFQNQEVEVMNISEFSQYQQLYNSSSRKLTPDVNVPAELNVTIGGTSVCATLDSVYYSLDNGQVTDKALRENNKIAKYTITSINGEICGDGYKSKYNKLFYNVTAKEIIQFNTQFVSPYSQEKISEEEFREIVEKDVTYLYGKDFLSKYSVKIYSNYKKPTALSEGGWQYGATFYRIFCGYELDERVGLSYNGSGQLYNITPKNLNAFDGLESKLNEESLTKVEEKAQILLNGRLVADCLLYMDNDGDIWALYEYFKREGDDGYPNETYGGFCIKIDIE